jgi:probable HAF family extracellular repeat protein
MPRRAWNLAWTLPALGALAAMGPVQAEDKTLLIELDPRSDALPNAVNPTGTVVVGKFATSGGFYWMPTTGVIDLGGGFATGVSTDGNTIVGGARDGQGIQNFGIWLRATEWRLLGSFPNAAPCDLSLSNANGVSRDGSVAVGGAYDGCKVFHAFKWQESTGVVDLGSLEAGRASRADAVSGDGRVVVGFQETAVGERRGARWVDGKEELFEGPIGVVGGASATNIDGSIVTGGQCRFGDPFDQSAWIWTASGGVECLPAPGRRQSDLVIITRASATSDDGRVIGGGQTAGGLTEDSEAVIWINRSPAYLKDFLRANGVPDAFDTWLRTGEIRAVSPDGRVLVGWGAAIGGFRGYIVILGSSLVMP